MIEHTTAIIAGKSFAVLSDPVIPQWRFMIKFDPKVTTAEEVRFKFAKCSENFDIAKPYLWPDFTMHETPPPNKNR